MNPKRSTLLILMILSANAHGQHDPARNAVRLLAADQTDDAVKMLTGARKKRRAPPISAAERCFVLAMAACRQGDAAAAYDHARQAVDNGLPPERFQAGPRDVLAPLYAHGEFKKWMAAKRKPLLHGPLLGSLTDTSVRFWVRTSEEIDVRVMVQVVGENAGRAAPITGKARTSSALDYTAIINVSGLSPNTRYRYEVHIDNKRARPPAEFVTYPKQGTPARFSVAFGGGAGYTPQHEHMWSTVAKQKPIALLLLGDNVYIDDPTHQMTQRYCYYRRQSQPDWRRLVASTSVYSIYDDHDFGDNDCVPGPDIEKPEWKRHVWNTFKQNWNNPSYGGGTKQPGCWYSFHIGNVHFIMLDGRYYRDLKNGSMLGPVQKAWLFETLKSSRGTFKVLASPVPWSAGVKPGSKDTWDGFRAERAEVFSFIEKHRVDGVILMAADRHRSDLRKTGRPKGYDLYEVMSSRLTNIHTHRLIERAKGSQFIMGYNKKCSFGLMDFNTIEGDPQAKYRIVNIDGKEIHARTLKLSQLSFGVQGGARQDGGRQKNQADRRTEE